jgi:hypothetical protein
VSFADYDEEAVGRKKGKRSTRKVGAPHNECSGKKADLAGDEEEVGGAEESKLEGGIVV